MQDRPTYLQWARRLPAMLARAPKFCRQWRHPVATLVRHASAGAARDPAAKSYRPPPTNFSEALRQLAARTDRCAGAP